MPSRRTGGKSGQQVGKTGIGKAIANDHRRRTDEFAPGPRGFGTEKTTGVSENQAHRSVLEQNSLDDFLAQAALGRADFPAERQRWGDPKMDDGPRLVAFLPTGGEAEAASNRAQVAAARIVVPIPWRPVWQSSGNGEELATAEAEAFLEWRRELASLEEKEHVVMTPYERNLDFWRQLWRCCERSDLVVQIVDARDPYFYRSRDLERYLRERFPNKRHLLLMNKSDFLDPAMRRRWAAHFARPPAQSRREAPAAPVEVCFFSALRELHRQHRVPSSSSRWDPAAGGARGSGAASRPRDSSAVEEEAAEEPPVAAAEPVLPPHGSFDSDDPVVLDCGQLLDELRSRLPPLEGGGGEVADASVAGAVRKGCIGFVGYPNVGKSSVINALYGAKKVSMSRTPGKTKHLQTLDLPGTDLTLCDCPGLVFPSVVATRAHLAINGTVPLVELRDSVQPVRLIVDKMGSEPIAQKYELSDVVLKEGEKRLGTHADAARRLLAGYATEFKRFLRLGVPDETWAARRILHDYCTGALLHCEPPPDEEASARPPAAAQAPAAPAAAAGAEAPAAPAASPGSPGGSAEAAAPLEGGKAAEVAEEGGESDDFSDLDAFLGGDAAAACAGPQQKGRRGEAAGRRRKG